MAENVDSPITIAGTAPVLLVEDVSMAVAYYCVILGFKVEFTQNEQYMGVFRDGVHVHLAAANGAPLHSNRVAWTEKFKPADVNFFVSDVDALYAEYTARGVEFTEEPHQMPYGIDCGFRDPSGNSVRLTQLAEIPVNTG